MIEEKFETAGDYRRAYYLKNREKIRQYSNNYHHWVKKNPEYREKLNARQRESYRKRMENPETREKARAYQKAYRQRKKAEKSAQNKEGKNNAVGEK